MHFSSSAAAAFCKLILKLKVKTESANRSGLLPLMCFPVYGTLTPIIQTDYSKYGLNNTIGHTKGEHALLPTPWAQFTFCHST